jgi:hypothetical protein
MQLVGLKVLASSAILVGIAACSKNLDFEIPRGVDLSLTIRDGRSYQSCEIEASSSDIENLATWLKDNSSGWESTWVTYAPGVLVTGPGFSINFMNEAAVINYEGGQYARPVTSASYSHLVCRGGT